MEGYQRLSPHCEPPGDQKIDMSFINDFRVTICLNKTCKHHLTNGISVSGAFIPFAIILEKRSRHAYKNIRAST
jgi:hypothetical protein